MELYPHFSELHFRSLHHYRDYILKYPQPKWHSIFENGTGVRNTNIGEVFYHYPVRAFINNLVALRVMFLANNERPN